MSSQIIFLNVEFGEFRCSSMPGDQGNELCAIKANTGGDTLPPITIKVDFGDDSGEQIWTTEDPRNLWSHQYQMPGIYMVHVSCMLISFPPMLSLITTISAKNEFDDTRDESWMEVEVVDPIFEKMGMEVQSS